MKPAFQKIALLHHAGGGNLGDDAIIDAVIENIRSRCPDAHIAAFSMNPADTQQRHGIPSFPIRSFSWSMGYASAKASPQVKGPLAAAGSVLLRKVNRVFREIGFWASSFARLRPFHLLIVSGGGQLTERSGPWGFPYALFVWAILAKLARVRLIFLNVGAGPLHHPLSRFFAARSLSAAAYVSFRDQPSKDLATEIGYRGKGDVSPDNVYGATFVVPVAAENALPHLTVGVAPMSYPYCDPREHAAQDLQFIYEDFLARLALFADSVHKQSCLVQLFGSDIGTDPPAIQDLHDALLKHHNLDIAPTAPIHSLQDLLAVISGMDVVVTCRYHGVVLAHLLNKPVLAIAHHPKVTALMDALGLSQYCIDIRALEPERLTEMFASLVQHRDEVRAQMAAVLIDFRQQVASQFDALFLPVAGDQPLPVPPRVAGAPAAEIPPG